MTELDLSNLIDEHFAIQKSLAIVTFTAEGKITSANENFLNLVGYKLDEVIGRHHSMFVSPQDAFSPAYVAFWNSLRRGESQTHEYRRRKQNGDDVWIQGCHVPITSDDGVVRRVIKFAMDITEKKIAEFRSQSIIKSIDQSHAMIEFELDGTIVDANQNFLQMFGYTRQEVCGSHHRMLVDESEQNSEAYRDFWAALKKGEFQVSRFKRIAKDGREVWIQGSYNPIFDTSGRIARVVKFAVDITEQKRFERQLEVASRLANAANVSKSEFLANMSHEIRTPMTAILGYTELLLDDANFANQPQQRVETIQTIQRNGEHLLHIIDDILDISKIESGKMEVESIACSPVDIVEGVLALMRVRAATKGIALDAMYSSEMPATIESDPTRLRQIILNLVGNAIKFTQTGSVGVQVRMTSDVEPMLEIDVVDTGVGMNAEQQSRLFSSFSQADSSTTRVFGGTGLGLSISKRLAMMLGGDVVIVSSHLGIGSRFRATVSAGSCVGVKDVSFVNKSSMLVEAPAPNPLPVNDQPLRGYRILLAEDGPDNQRLISFILKKAGLQVSVVENGRLAVELALKAQESGYPFDAILMDMQMPVMDGYAAASMLRTKGFCGYIIALTAHAMDGDRVICLNAGCNDYATKPIDRVGLIEKIRSHFSATVPA